MTTYVDARDTLVTYINEAWVASQPTVPIFYENTKQIQLDTAGPIFLVVAINFSHTVREGIDRSPISATAGMVTLRLFSKEGQGVRATLALMDYLMALMKYREIAGVTLGCPTPGRKTSKDGWTSQDLNVGFSFWQ